LTIIGGVETNKSGEVVAYHIKNTHPLSGGFLHGDWKRVEAFGKKTGRRNVIHLMNRERIGQRRGVPFLAPIIESLKQLGRYNQAEIDAAVINALWAVFIEKKRYNGEGSVIGSFESYETEGQQGDSEPNDIEINSGTIVDLNEGEEAKLITPGRPNPNYDNFITAFTRHVGSALEIPYEILIKHFTSSFSASRGALLEFWKSVRMFRSWFASDFCQAIYEEWFAEAVALGRISAPGFFMNPVIRKAYSGAEWHGPAQGLLNPIHEVRAAQLRVENCFSTRDQEAREMNGSDFHKNVNQRKNEERLMQEVEEIKRQGE
jgi:lambda family phage portal protein